jgi:hypothetical protein
LFLECVGLEARDFPSSEAFLEGSQSANQVAATS